MFGYVVPEKPEMKIKEYELYRAYYCGVCKAMGKRLGQLSRLTLTYDAAFLAILLSALSGAALTLRRERCMVHPLKKSLTVNSNHIIGYVSDINLMLAYYNLEDNWRDERSLPAGAGRAALSRAFEKARKRRPEKCALIEQRLKELSLLEAEGVGSMDMAAEPFSKLMEEVLDYPPTAGEDTRRALRWLGYNLGKWLYLLDAYDDLERDIKSGSYNPLIKQFGYGGEEVGAFRARLRDRVEFNLTHALSEISKAYELLQTKSNKGIIENIIYMGMLRKTENILKAGSCENIEKSL